MSAISFTSDEEEQTEPYVHFTIPLRLKQTLHSL